jgi:hypothetical protein
MTGSVKIQLDLTKGIALVEAPVEALDAVFDKLYDFLPRLKEAQAGVFPPAGDGGASAVPANVTPIQAVTAAEPAARAKRSPQGSKPEIFKPVDLGLNEPQKAAFKSFYQAHHVDKQNDQVLVIMYWLIKEVQKAELSKQEIYTGFATVGATAPTRLSPVMSNLKKENFVAQNGDKFALQPAGEDYVLSQLLNTLNANGAAG